MSETDLGGRGLFTGVANIVRFNPGFYMAGSSMVVAAAIGMGLLDQHIPDWICYGGWIALGLALWWLLASLAVSWWIYDLSGLYRWGWLEPHVGREDSDLLAAHAGFDEVTLSLRRRFPYLRVIPLDFHDEARMTEPSIRRARKRYPALPDTLRAGLDDWAVERPADRILFVLSAHEWRRSPERIALLQAASVCLAPAGSILLLEHLRDLRNFVAFGPGFLHFHSAETWERDWKSAGLKCVHRFTVGGFLAGFVLCPVFESDLHD